ncbi:lipocalin family protein [Methylomonas sp. EFPC1]|uniref:lipocalin family protein n=1 Tax=unclassified Methylomonas TaxID=2608980 RepID=UPI00051B5108|nr:MULTISPECIES: lipocalin family protein [unclassified Methylomonas]QBC27060.1 lipocalin [Methylomonas sp. LW13]QSB02942.1 lipocalin family protein [Methylomonas sp. EFPC1]
MRYLPILLLSLLCACTDIPEGVKVIDGFELNRYLGTWYEIARLDHSFERGLTDISAEYSLRDDGGVKVLNSGYDAEQGQRKIAEGKAYFIDKPDIGRLKVSFFGPFYGAYNIIALDKTTYSYVMIAGPDRDYLWILARSPELEPSIQKDLIEQAKTLGFATDKLIFDQHPKQ